MSTVQNQKRINVHSAMCDKSNLYGNINLEANLQAVSVLSANAYKVWIALALNQNGYSFDLSAVDICKRCAIGETTYHKVIKELVEKGFLVQRHEHSNIYDFWELQSDKDRIPNETKKQNKSTEEKVCVPEKDFMAAYYQQCGNSAFENESKLLFGN